MSSIRRSAPFRLLRSAWEERGADRARHALGFLRYVLRRFLDDQCPLWAGMLCFASLLALVPLMVVTFGVISAFPVFQEWSQTLRDFIFANFVPATGEVIQRYVDRFVDKATELSAVGVLMLILSSILLMVNMERALNRIWRASSPRSPGRRFVVYWSVLTVGPILLGASMAISSYVISLPLVEEAAATLGVRGLFLAVAPFLFSTLAFTLIFVIVPSVSVPWRFAAGGGLVAALLFEASKGAFALYVTNFPTYETMYGAFAAFPIFLLWVYLSWIVTLVGASFGAALGSYRFSSHRAPWPENRELLLLFRLLEHLWQAQKSGQGRSTRSLLELEPRAGHDQTLRLLRAAERGDLLKLTDDGSWMLARDLDDVSLLELWRLVAPLPLPLPTDGEDDDGTAMSQPLQESLRKLEEALKRELDRPLTDLFSP